VLWLERLITVWVWETPSGACVKAFIAFGNGSLHLCVTMDASRPWKWNLLSVWQWISPLHVKEATFTLIWDLPLHLYELACVHVPSTDVLFTPALCWNLWMASAADIPGRSTLLCADVRLCYPLRLIIALLTSALRGNALTTFASGSLRFVYIWITFLHAQRLCIWMPSILYTLRIYVFQCLSFAPGVNTSAIIYIWCLHVASEISL